MKKIKSQSGFVYLARHPQHPTWIKIGFTRRSPFHRLKELSGTSVRSSFEFIQGAFVWNAILTEKKMHDWLQSKNIIRQKEFFETDIDVVKDLLLKMEEYDLAHHRPLNVRTNIAPVAEDNWDDFERNLISDHDDYLAHQDMKSWNTSDLHADRKWKQALGQRQLEKMSSQGDPEASIILAEHIICISGDEQHWRHADCLYQAAIKQGEASAQLRSLFWKTFWSPSSLGEYWSALAPWRDMISNQCPVPDLVSQTFSDEQALWVDHPERAHSFASWYSSSNPRP